ncbi:restriction endonuclease subunit S [Vibrio fluvialis]|nr:restriction endonuclease subunit S [Vibrio fluvialis]
MSWPMVKLGSVIEPVMGQAPPGTECNKNGLGTVFVKAGEFGKEYPEVKEWTTKPLKFAKEGDTLLCVVGATCGKVNKAIDCAIGRSVAAIRPNLEKIDSNYLFYFISSWSTKLRDMSQGAAQTVINKDMINSLEIPLPTLAEQKHIAAILDKADAVRQKRKQVIELADEFLRSVFLDMFGDPVANPKGWEVKPVGELVKCIVPGRDKPKSFTGEMPWITTNDLQHLGTTTYSDKGLGLSDEEISEVKARIIPKGSVLMTCVGDLGIISLAGNNLVMNQQLHAFLHSEYFEQEFLMFALSFQKAYMLKMASSTTVPYMNKTVCNSVPVIVPTLTLQQQFKKIYLNTVCTIEKYQSANCEKLSLFNSLSQKAFSGQL